MKRIALLFLTICIAASSLRADYDADAAERKADLYFMEAMRQRALGNDDAHFRLLNRAYELTPDKSGREAYEVGVRKLFFAVQSEDSVGYQNALAMIDGYFNAHQSDIYAGAYLANLYVREDKVDKAIKIYEIMEAQKPNNATLVGNHADLLMRAERFDEAIALYKQLEKSLGKNIATTQRISNIMIWQGDTIAAFAEMDSLIAAQPRSIEALHLAASAASEFGYPQKALNYLDRAKILDPANGTTYYYAANAYKVLGREKEYDEAIVAALTGEDLECEDKLELLRYYIAEVMDKENFSEILAPIFESLVAQYPYDYAVRKVYASYFVVQSLWADAAEQVALAIDIDPTNAGDYEMLARLYVSDSNFTMAVSTLNAAIEKMPGNLSLRELLAGVHLLAEDYQSSIAVLEDALTIPGLTDMERSEFLSGIADAMQNIEGREADAAQYYEKALAADFSNSLAMNNYAYFLATHSGDLLRAKELIAKAVLYNPGSSTYYDTYAWVMFKLGDLQEAKRYIDLAILSDKNDAGDAAQISDEILDHAAQIYDALGQHDVANEYRSRMQEPIEP